MCPLKSLLDVLRSLSHKADSGLVVPGRAPHAPIVHERFIYHVVCVDRVSEMSEHPRNVTLQDSAQLFWRVFALRDPVWNLPVPYQRVAAYRHLVSLGERHQLVGRGKIIRIVIAVRSGMK